MTNSFASGFIAAIDIGAEITARAGIISQLYLTEDRVSIITDLSHDVDRPGTTFSAYCDGLIDVGYSRLPPDNAQFDSRQHESPITHSELLEAGRQVLRKLSEDPRIQKSAIPTLFHPDLHMRNIFVSEMDPTIVTSFIDWQSSSIEPAIEYTDDVPDFATSTLDTATSEDEGRLKKTDVICRTTTDACLHGLLPKLSYARIIDDKLLLPFRLCHRAWIDGPAVFREQLIQLAKSWTDLGIKDICPYRLPNQDALDDQASKFQAYLTAYAMSREIRTSYMCRQTAGWQQVNTKQNWKLIRRRFMRS